MSSKLTLLEYVSSIEPFSNQPIDLHTLLSPFGIYDASEKKGSLLVGEFIDELCCQLDTLSLIDVSTVIDILSELEVLDWVDDLVDELQQDDDIGEFWIKNDYNITF